MHQLLWNTSYINTGSTQAPDRTLNENETQNNIKATLRLMNFCFHTDTILQLEPVAGKSATIH